MAMGVTQNPAWGGVAASGQVYAVLQQAAGLYQTVSGLQTGDICQVYWSQASRLSVIVGRNDMHVQVSGRTVFVEPLVLLQNWASKQSDPFKVVGTSAELKFYTTNLFGDDATVFIDNIRLTCKGILHFTHSVTPAGGFSLGSGFSLPSRCARALNVFRSINLNLVVCKLFSANA